MKREDCKKYLRMLGQELQKQQVTGEIMISDGMTVLLDISKPEIRRDISAYLAGDETAIDIPDELNDYFGKPGVNLRKAILDIAGREGLSNDWLNNILSELFYIQTLCEQWVEDAGIRVYLALPAHMLAMKVATADSLEDIEDIQILAHKLQLSTPQEVVSSIKIYIPQQLLTSEMRFVIKQCFEMLKEKV